MAGLTQKTPISLLQELCVQQGITSEYKLMSVEGAVHAPTFMYRVQVSNCVATATGASKKKAKHAAAKTVLEKLLTKDGGFESGFVSDGVLITTDTFQDIIANSVASDLIDGGISDDVQGNPVGALQELCMRRHWQPPQYETENESGLPHERTFTIACLVDRFSETGIGKSKRLAKRQAADRMLRKLESLDECSSRDSDSLNDSTKEKTSTSKPTIHSLYYKRVHEFLEGLKASTSPCLNELQKVDLTDENLNCTKLLQSIGTEQDFDIKYVPLDRKGKSGDYHCLVQIESLPVAVCFGMGHTREEAQINSARNALNFLQIMCRR